MAGHVLATIYGTVQSYDRYNGGYQMTGWNSGPSYLSFPSVGTIFIGVSPAETLATAAGTFTINAIIQVVSSGLNQAPAQYATDSTVSTLNTGAA